MKTSILMGITLASAALYSCSQNNGATTKKPENPIATTCYMAVDGKDTARMELNQFSKNMGGNLVISFAKKDNNNGTIEGKFKGDTLYADYIFKVGKDKQAHMNPLAFLKQDGKLIMGVGKMESTLGRTYFRKDVPIDFTQGRFTFIPVPCKK